MSQSAASAPDAYSQAALAAPPIEEKLAALRGFLAKHSTVILTTRAPTGHLHARVMAIAEVADDWKLRFIYDADSYKDTEVEKDHHVNVAVDGSPGRDGWVSIAGKASTSNDKALVERLFTPATQAWFSDKGDGVHTGKPGDPRVAVLTVDIDEVRHFHQTKTALGTAVDVVASAIGGQVATPGQIREISGEEIRQAVAAGKA
ncbi:hypothetical protein Q5752_000141 [Cryptotrichosporon argae]